jgi:hypothetical protein
MGAQTLRPYCVFTGPRDPPGLRVHQADPTMVRGAQGGLTRPAAAKRSCRRRVTDACRTIRELHRLLGKKTSETEILEEALEHATSQKTAAAAAVAAEGRFPTKTVAELIPR